MLSGLKFIPRDQIDAEQDENVHASRKERKKSGGGKGKDRRKKNTSRYSSSNDDDLERIGKRSRKKKKWYSSDEDLPLDSTESESENEKKRRNRKKVTKGNEDSSEDEGRGRSRKKSTRKKQEYSSEDYSSHDSQSDDGDGHSSRGGKKKRSKKVKKRGSKKNDLEEELHDDDGGSHSLNAPDIVRKEMGLEWMLRPNDNVEKKITIPSDNQPDEPPAEEIKRANPRELNPFLKDNGSGFPEDANGKQVGGTQLLSSSVVGDGGASWRLKALKRAQEQAAREGRKLEEVVGERWDSLGQLTVSVSSHAAAPSRAHLHAIQNRKKALTEEQQTRTDNKNAENIGRERPRDASMRHPQMRVPKLHDSLSWGKQKSQKVSTKDAGLISSAVASINKFSNDGSFMRDVKRQQNDKFGGSFGSSYSKGEKEVESELVHPDSEMRSGDVAIGKQALSANQLAAKALQLRMKGNHEEADKLLEEVENIRAKESASAESGRPQNVGTTSRHMMGDISIRQKKKEEDADMHLAQTIVENKRYSISGRADDEYDFDDGPRRKNRKKGSANDHKPTQMTNIGSRILTQQERCQFCFENPKRPRHLVVSIANFSYLTLPHWQPVVPGHCCILPMQHESATRSVDNNVWGEIRNFKKCLIMMFAKQDKEPVFLETVMGLAQQRRHCLVDCIPLPRETAKQAPLYFKKAIDEAEDEWSQHNAKKLIDTTEKGLRGSIPKDFPYFYVEFGLDKGFVHVIDDETNFKSNFGLNVVRGMLRLPEEDMYGRRKHDSVDTQKESVASFAKDWESFDWTKQLD